MIATGIDAIMDDGDIQIKVNTNYWTLLDGDYRQALGEYLYIICQYLKDDTENNPISKHFYHLYEDVYIHCVSLSQTETNLLNIKKENDFSERIIDTIPDGEISEACFQFAIFYLCRELARLSGYVYKDIEKPLNLQAETKENIFCKEKKIESYNNTYINDNDNEIAKKYLEIIDGELFEILAPIYSVSEVFDKIVKYKGWKKESLSEEQIQQVYEIIDKLNICSQNLLNDIAKTFFEGITGKKDAYRESIICGVGDGGRSTGFLGIQNLGIFLYSYGHCKNIKKFLEQKSITRIYNNASENSVTIDDTLHFYIYGYEKGHMNFATQTITFFHLRNKQTIFKFEGNSKTFNGIRPKRNRDTTYPYSYQSNEETEHTIEQDYQTEFYRASNRRKIGEFNRKTNDLILHLDRKINRLNFNVTTENQDEIFVMMNISQTVEKKDSIFLKLEDIFSNNKFEVKESIANDFFSDSTNLEKFNDIIVFLETANNPCIETKIKGYYVGIYTIYGQGVNADIKPIVKNNQCDERTYDKEGDEKLRYSYVFIQLDKKANKITIEIWSTTSPLRSRLDNDLIPAYLNENGDNIDSSVLETLNDKYTNSHKILVEDGKLIPIYNQPLAMLRSMGVLEAIAKQIIKNTTNNVEVVQEAMNKMMNNAIAEDESWEIRGKIGENYQVPNGINYETYRRFKWYKNCDEYELYDHSINFNEN